MKIKDFRELKIWQQGKQIVLDIYKVTKDFPRDEIFGLTSQLRRAAVSIPSNIAEGFNRSYKKEYQRYLSIALGSCGEIETQIEISFQLAYITIDEKEQLLENIGHEARMLRTVIKTLI